MLCRVKRNKLVTLYASAALLHHGLICLTFFLQGFGKVGKGL